MKLEFLILSKGLLFSDIADCFGASCHLGVGDSCVSRLLHCVHLDRMAKRKDKFAPAESQQGTPAGEEC